MKRKMRLNGDDGGFLVAAGLVAGVLVVVLLAVLYATNGGGDSAPWKMGVAQEFCEPSRVEIRVLWVERSVDARELVVAPGTLDQSGPVKVGGLLTVRDASIACRGEAVIFTHSGSLVSRLVTHQSFI